MIDKLDNGTIVVSPIATFPLLTTFNCAFNAVQNINVSKVISVFFISILILKVNEYMIESIEPIVVRKYTALIKILQTFEYANSTHFQKRIPPLWEQERFSCGFRGVL